MAEISNFELTATDSNYTLSPPDYDDRSPTKNAFIDPAKFKESGDITKEEFAQIIQQHADEQSVNWGEIDDVSQLYALADSASKGTGGIPDSILKDAMFYVLQLHFKISDGWLRNHIVKLQKMWRDEMNSEKVKKRETMIPMESKAIHPFNTLKRKRNHMPSNVAQSVMGVSALLSHTRTTMKLDDGEHVVVETPEGNIQVDGEPLTFDTWSKLSGNDDEVISYKGQEQFANKVQPKPNIMSVEAAPQPCKRARRRLNFVLDTSLDCPADIPRRRTVSEEGECSDSDDDSTSTDDLDSDEEKFKNRRKKRRAVRRQQLRQNVHNNHYLMKRRMQDMYCNRFDIVCYLSVRQKVELLKSLNMVYEEHDCVMEKKAKLANFLAQP